MVLATHRHDSVSASLERLLGNPNRLNALSLRTAISQYDRPTVAPLPCDVVR